MLKVLLQRSPGAQYVCIEAQTCAQALEVCRRDPPDCILLDYNMPDMDGVIFLKKLQHEGLSHVPVIMVTAFSTEALVVHAFKTGVQDFLRKDRVNTDSLCHAIRFAVYKKQSEKALLLRELDLQERMDEINRLNVMIAHDLKSPLVTIKTFLGYLERDLGARDIDSAGADLAHLLTATEKMDHLVGELIDVARVGRSQMPDVTVPMQEVLQDALGLLSGRIALNNTDIRITNEPLVLKGVRAELVCLFQNLIDNAVKFMDNQPEPRIEIGTESRDGETVLFVRDNGRGIEPQNSEKLFEMFEKLDDAGQGSGIGLALAKKVVESHGGRIWVESEGLGKGSCFCFVLPQKMVQG